MTDLVDALLIYVAGVLIIPAGLAVILVILWLARRARPDPPSRNATHDITLPAGIEAGDLIVIWSSTQDSSPGCRQLDSPPREGPLNPVGPPPTRDDT
jgi:hypothetical protein